MNMEPSMVLSLLISVISSVYCNGKVQNIYWNTTTARKSLEPFTVTVNEGNLPWEYDQVNIICPVYKPGHGGEQHIIYSVEKEEFDNCRVTSPRPKIVAICNRPQTFMYFTVTFRSFTPTPGGLEFIPGNDYYFISTSTSKDIHRRVGGWCQSHNMKMKFRVAENIKEDHDTSTTDSPVPTPAAFWSKYWKTHVPGQQENYKVNQEESAMLYQQSSRDTYFRQQRNSQYHQPLLDESVDIRITARSFKSSCDTVTYSYLIFTITSILSLLLH